MCAPSAPGGSKTCAATLRGIIPGGFAATQRNASLGAWDDVTRSVSIFGEVARDVQIASPAEDLKI